MKAKALKFTKNHGFHRISRKHGNGRFSLKKANFTENVTAVKSWIRLVPTHHHTVTLTLCSSLSYWVLSVERSSVKSRICSSNLDTSSHEPLKCLQDSDNWSSRLRTASVFTASCTDHVQCSIVFSFDLPRQQWSLLNRFRTEQGHCGACRRKWRLTDTDLCPCGETQTMSHIVECCPLTKLNGGLSRLHSADEDTVSWLINYG